MSDEGKAGGEATHKSSATTGGTPAAFDKREASEEGDAHDVQDVRDERERDEAGTQTKCFTTQRQHGLYSGAGLAKHLTLAIQQGRHYGTD